MDKRAKRGSLAAVERSPPTPSQQSTSFDHNHSPFLPVVTAGCLVQLLVFQARLLVLVSLSEYAERLVFIVSAYTMDVAEVNPREKQWLQPYVRAT